MFPVNACTLGKPAEVEHRDKLSTSESAQRRVIASLSRDVITTYIGPGANWGQIGFPLSPNKTYRVNETKNNQHCLELRSWTSELIWTDYWVEYKSTRKSLPLLISRYRMLDRFVKVSSCNATLMSVILSLKLIPSTNWFEWNRRAWKRSAEERHARRGRFLG